MGKIDFISSGGGGSGSAALPKVVYTPPMSPVTLSQGDEVIISHPPVASGMRRSVSIWNRTQYAGNNTVLADFDLADASEYIFEDVDAVLLNGGIAIKRNSAPEFNYLQMDFRDAYLPNPTGSVQDAWRYFDDPLENLSNLGGPSDFTIAKGAGHYYATQSASDDAYIEFTVPSDLPVGTYAMHVFGLSYFGTNGVAWAAYRINGGARIQKPDAHVSWNNSNVRKWWPLGDVVISPGDRIKFVRPDNANADMGGVNFGSLCFTPTGQTPVNVPTGQEGTLKSYTSGSYPIGAKYVITPAIDIATKRIVKINSITHDATIPANTAINGLVSFDDGATFKYYNGSSWVTAAEGTIRQQLNAHTYNITTVLGWLSNYVCVGNEKIRIALDLSTTSLLATPYLSTLTINYDLKFCYALANDSDFMVDVYDNSSVVVSKVSAGTGLTIIEVEI